MCITHGVLLRFMRLGCELGVVEGGVEAAFLHQLFVVALFDDVAVADDKDHIRVLDGAQTVSDDESGNFFCNIKNYIKTINSKT